MGLLKFKDFDKMRREVKEQKLKEASFTKYKKFFSSTLSEYGVNDPSELDEDQYIEFTEKLKIFKSK
jgi:hypothetical protein